MHGVVEAQRFAPLFAIDGSAGLVEPNYAAEPFGMIWEECESLF